MMRTDHPLPLAGAGSPAIRLERSVASALRVIAAACAERDAPPVKAARRQLAEIYGATRLSRHQERRGTAA